MSSNAELSISPQWKQRTLDLFKLQYQDASNEIYKLNAKMLDKKECHFFFDSNPCIEFLIATALEFSAFHPKTPRNKKFNYNRISFGDKKLLWCSFPLEYKEACERISKTFKMKMYNNIETTAEFSEKRSSHLLEDEKGKDKAMEAFVESLFPSLNRDPKQPEAKPKIRSDALAPINATKKPTLWIHFPAAENLLVFDGQRNMDTSTILQQHEEIVIRGNAFHSLDVD